MDLTKIKEGLHELFPLFHIMNNAPVEYVFDMNTQELLSTFLILENIDYGYPLYVKLDFHTGELSECYPMFCTDFKQSLNYLNCLNNMPEHLDTYFAVPITCIDGKYRLQEQDTYSRYYPQKDGIIVRKRDGVSERTYKQCKKLCDVSFPIYWKTRDLIVNSKADYMIFYFKDDLKKPEKLVLGINYFNPQYPDMSKLIQALRD